MKFSVVAIVFQVILIILFATLVKYDPNEAGASIDSSNITTNVNTTVMPRGENIRLYPSMFKVFYPFTSGAVVQSWISAYPKI